MNLDIYDEQNCCRVCEQHRNRGHNAACPILSAPSPYEPDEAIPDGSAALAPRRSQDAPADRSDGRETKNVPEILAKASNSELLAGIFTTFESLAGTEWPDPDADGRTEPLPPFPVDALPADLGKFVSALAIYQQIAADVPALTVLGALAATAGHHATVRGQWVEAALNLFAAPQADSGEGKSPVMAMISAPLLKLQKDLRRGYELAYGKQVELYEIAEKRRTHILSEIVKAAGAKRIKLQAELDDVKQEIKDTRPPPYPRLLAGDVTPEALAKIMRGNDGHIAILSAEGGFFGTISGRYSRGQPNVDLVLNALDVREPYVSDRKTNDENFEIDRPSLTLVLCVQPVVIQEARSVKALMDRGLLYRFLYSASESMAGQRDKAPPQVPVWLIEEWDTTIRTVYTALLARDNDEPVVDESTGEQFPPFSFDADKQLKSPSPMVVDGQAEAMHLQWRRALEKRVDPDEGDLNIIKGWVKKLEGTTYRIAALLHLAAGHSPRVPIDAHTMASAIRIGDWAIPHALASLTAMGATAPGADLEPAHRVLRWIKRKAPEAFSSRDLYRGVRNQNWVDPKNGGGGADAVSVALLKLMRTGWVASVARAGADGRSLNDGLFVPHPALRGESA